MKRVEALVLIADGLPDSEGEMFHLTGRTIQDKVPVTIDSRIAYSNWVGYASLELRGDKLYASFEVPDEVEGKFCPIVISSDGWIGESGDINDIIDPIIRSISLLAVGEDRGTNSDDRIPNIEL